MQTPLPRQRIMGEGFFAHRSRRRCSILASSLAVRFSYCPLGQYCLPSFNSSSFLKPKNLPIRRERQVYYNRPLVHLSVKSLLIIGEKARVNDHGLGGNASPRKTIDLRRNASLRNDDTVLHFGPYQLEGVKRLWCRDQLLEVRPRPLTVLRYSPSHKGLFPIAR